MFYEDNEDNEKKLLEDIKFKRRAVFIDDDSLTCEVKASTKDSKKGDSKNRECQVDLQNDCVDEASQTRNKKHREIQTDIVEDLRYDNVKYDENSLIKFLRKKLDLVEECLEENNQSSAFSNYDVDWSEGGTTITNPFTLIDQQLVKDQELEVTNVAWNCRGATICVSYGRFDHESVCTHKGALCTWNIDLLKIKFDKPDISIETQFCITAMATHPEHPGIVAVGLFNGEILVYDIRQNDPLVASILDKNDLHSDEITTLRWIKDIKTTKKKYYLLSASRDGKILIWNALPTKSQLKLHDGFIILLDDLPKQSYKSLGTEMGVTSVSVNYEDKDIFVIGCDSGGLFKCSFSSLKKATPKWSDQLSVNFFKSPITLSFDVQYGPIYSTNFSPFHRNLFLTCGTDSEIKLYSLLQTNPLLQFCPNQGYLYSVDWSTSRPCVFACGSHKGQILFYDLSLSTSTSCQSIQASERPIYALEFNHSRPGYMATGDAAGFVKIWALSRNLINKDSHELQKLTEISQKPFET